MNRHEFVAPYQAELHYAGLPADFLDRLRPAADRVLGAVDGAGAGCRGGGGKHRLVSWR